MTDPAAYVMYAWFYELLSHFLKVNPVGLVMGLEFGFRLKLPGKTTVRKPDLALILNSNPVQPSYSDAAFKGVFDLCVESLSHSSKKVITRDTVLKKKEYSIIGVKEYYILDSNGRETSFYRRGKQGRYEHIKPVNGVIRSGILPGFRFRVADLYNRPSLIELADDKVYIDFVMPFYTEEKKRVEREKKKVERIIKKLRSLGLSEQEIESLTDES